MKKPQRFLTSILNLLLVGFLVIPIRSVAAQVTTGDGWENIMTPDGTIDMDQVIDLGESKEPVRWMPNLENPDLYNPFSEEFGNLYAEPGEATYHRYMDKDTGNIVVVPSASTLLMMAWNRESSGYAEAEGQMANGVTGVIQAPGLIKSMLEGVVNPQDVLDLGYSSPDQFFNAVADGKESLWSLPLGSKSMLNFISMWVTDGWNDKNLYTTMLMYNPGSCASAPGGCPAELAKVLADPNCKGPYCTHKTCQTADCKEEKTPMIKIPKCPAPEVKPGKVATSANFTAPQHPIVVGQDPEKRGVDLNFTVTVPPTIVTYYELHEEDGGYCTVEVVGEGYCPADKWVGNGDPKFECIARDLEYRESVTSASARATLSGSSRSWITTDLAARYPGATLKHPDWTWSNGTGGFQGNTYVWTLTIPRVQVADPGWYEMSLSGMTSGTAVGPARSFGGGSGRFGVYLMEATIIE